MLPNRIKLSKIATDKLRNIKGQTGLPLNVLARIAIMLALRDGSNLNNAGIADTDGQELNKSVLFGEHENVYEVTIFQYIHVNDIVLPIQQAIASLVEIGVHKMGHVKELTALCDL